MRSALIIPARYGSTRFPGKPLVSWGGQSMLSRVVDISRQVQHTYPHLIVAVATEDTRIESHCRDIGVDCVMTPDDCPTGSDRVLAACDILGGGFDVVLGLQGDAPFTPVKAPLAILSAFEANPDLSVVTPVVKLRWTELDALRDQKKTTPFSGTTCVVDSSGRAMWFSKQILPAIRREQDLRSTSDFSPVFQHIGLYGFRYDILKTFVTLKAGIYETLEGLEQLRLLENGIAVHTVTIDVDAGLAQAGIDSPEDVARAEALLARA
ncbi:MAG: 3-deoxy-manno-octulosonate cytidylyltransferase [Alphaproteobacteria bacterium]|nr:3-deoxy-manno-octulosonate cytidylyltransferase [Alphaproteobacteria bacterium]